MSTEIVANAEGVDINAEGKVGEGGGGANIQINIDDVDKSVKSAKTS